MLGDQEPARVGVIPEGRQVGPADVHRPFTLDDRDAFALANLIGRSET